MEIGQVGLVGDVAHHAAHRIGPEQGALRTGQDFDPVEVGRVDIEVAARSRSRRIVEVEPDAGLDPGNAEDLGTGCIGGQTTDIDR